MIRIIQQANKDMVYEMCALNKIDRSSVYYSNKWFVRCGSGGETKMWQWWMFDGDGGLTDKGWLFNSELQTSSTIRAI
jgi:hypothetical protein